MPNWDKMPNAVFRQYHKKRRLKEFVFQFFGILTLLGPFVWVWPWLKFKHLGENWMESSNMLVWKFDWLWKLLGSELSLIAGYISLMAVFVQVMKKVWKINEDNWEIYVDELNEKYPND